MNKEHTYHPEELENAEKENRPVLISQLFRYDHLSHTIPLGSLVKVHIKEDHEDSNGMIYSVSGDCILYVVAHTRDCDGTPLYSLSSIPVQFYKGGNAFAKERLLYIKFAEYCSHGFNAESLTKTGKVVSLAISIGEWMGV